MKNYLDLLQTILDKGTKKSDRTGTGTLTTHGTRLPLIYAGVLAVLLAARWPGFHSRRKGTSSRETQ